MFTKTRDDIRLALPFLRWVWRIWERLDIGEVARPERERLSKRHERDGDTFARSGDTRVYVAPVLPATQSNFLMLEEGERYDVAHFEFIMRQLTKWWPSIRR